MRVMSSSPPLSSSGASSSSEYSVRVPRTRSVARRAWSAATEDDGVQFALSPEEARTVVLRYPPDEPDAIHITKGDLERLKAGEFLNDSLVDFCLKRHHLRLREAEAEAAGGAGASSSSVEGVGSPCRHHFFSSFFFTKLRQTGANQELRRWTRSVKLFSGYGCWYVPCCVGLHWSLAVICNPRSAVLAQLSAVGDGSTASDALVLSEDSDAEGGGSGDTPFACILFFDSLKCHDALEVSGQLRQFLAKQWAWEHEGEGADDGSGAFKPDFNRKTMPLITPDIPMQDNSCDCGVFLLQYAEELLGLLGSKAVTKSLATSNFEGTGLRTSFNAEKIAMKRVEIASIVEYLRVQAAADSAQEDNSSATIVAEAKVAEAVVDVDDSDDDDDKLAHVAAIT